MKTKKLISSLIAILFFTASIYYIYWAFEWIKIFDALTTINLSYFITSSVITIILYWLTRTLRWFVILKHLQSDNIKLVDLYLPTACALGLSVITPFQSGELVKVELLTRNSEHKRFTGYTSFAIEKALDLITVIALALLTLPLFKYDLLNVDLLFKFLLIFTILLLSLCFFFRKPLKNSALYIQLTNLADEINFTPFIFLNILFLTVLGWFIVSLGWYFAWSAMDINTEFLEALAITSNITLLNIISLIPGAIGVSEAGISVALANFGYNLLEANLGAILIRGYTVAAIILGIIHFLFFISYKVSKKT